LGVVVSGTGLQPGERERGGVVVGTARRETAAPVVAVDRVEKILAILEAG
jgi:hypothetical protein